MRRCPVPQGLQVDAWRMVGPTCDRYAPPYAGSRPVAGRQPCGARDSPRCGGPVRTHERSGGTSLWQVERPAARTPIDRAAAPGGTRERPGAVPPGRGAWRADRLRDRLRRQSGHLRGVRVQQLPLRDGDAIVGALIVAFDVRQPPVEPVGLGREPRLTARQRQIVGLIASGLSTPKIARELTLPTETVRNHLRSVFREQHAHTRVEAIATAQRIGLLAAPALGPTPPDADVDTEQTRVG
jgi:DNA-binding CsgD family transcriptional regulator